MLVDEKAGPILAHQVTTSSSEDGTMASPSATSGLTQESPFDALPLDRSENGLRLWRFTPTASHACIQLELAGFKQCDTDDLHYIGLSYVWGSYEQTSTILVNGVPLQITQNLRDFVAILFQDGRYGRQWFWADQISINQQNSKERDHQVGLMGDIYTAAHSVFAYLGPFSQDRSTNLDVLSRNTLTQNAPASLEAITAYLDLFTRKYWSRLWIVQELRLVQQATFWCGSLAVKSGDLYALCCWMLRNDEAVYSKIADQQSDQFEPLAWICTQAEAFYGGQGKAIRSLVRFPSQWKHFHAMREVLELYGHNMCTDPRDKIFGLQALVEPSQRVSVDYLKPITQVVLDAFRVVITGVELVAEEYKDHQLVDVHLTSATTDIVKLFTELGLPEKQSSLPSQALLWSYLINNIADGIHHSVKRAKDEMMHNARARDDVCTTIRDMSWHGEDLFERYRKIWTEVLVLAITPVQKSLAAQLSNQLGPRGPFHPFSSERLNKSKLQLSSTLTNTLGSRLRNAGVKSPAAEFKLIAQIEDLCAAIRRAVRGCAVSRGFLTYGRFLCHPDEWPFPEISPYVVDKVPASLPRSGESRETDDEWPSDDFPSDGDMHGHDVPKIAPLSDS